MAQLTRVRCCPSCGHDRALRKRRKGWLRLFGNSALYQCNRCMQDYLVLGRRTKRALNQT